MTCGGCENAVKRTLQRVDGVEDVTASHAAGLVGVRFDDAKVTAETLKGKIESLGYVIAP